MYSLMLVFALLTQAADARGTWSIEPALGPNRTPIPGRIQFVFFLRGGITSRDTAFDPSVFRGLTPAQMASPVKTATRFEIVREAGTFVCEGYFEAGFGSGTYLFQPNPGFRAQMLAMGLRDDIDEGRLLDMALHEVGPRLLAELRDAGVSVSTASELMSMRNQGVTGDYVREIRQIVPSASSREMVNMRVQGIWPDYVREMRQMYPTASIQDLINMKVQAIWPDYAQEMRQIYPSASIRELINMKVQGIWPDNVRAVRQAYPSASIQDVIDMKIQGVGRR
jgi:hypothetical protein